jgi:carboxymethylenebutenolidase
VYPFWLGGAYKTVPELLFVLGFVLGLVTAGAWVSAHEPVSVAAAGGCLLPSALVIGAWGWAAWFGLSPTSTRGLPSPPLVSLEAAVVLSSAFCGALYALWVCALRAQSGEASTPLADSSPAPYPARSNAEDVMGERIEFEVGDGTCAGYVAKGGDGKAGLVVMQEWWGLVPHVEDVTNRLAAEGYTALAPDFYHGKSTVEAEEAQHLMEGLDWALAMQEIKAAADHLRMSGCTKVGVVGFCMGGALACLGAATAGVDAAVSFYGFPPPPNPMDTKCPPTQIFFGSDEGFFDVPSAQAWAEKQVGEHGVADTAVTIFEGAGHAFFNDTRPDAYHEASAKDAWERTKSHLAKHLKG